MVAWIPGPATAALDRCLLTFGTSLDELDLDPARVVLSSYRTTTSSDGDGALLLIHLDGDRTLRLIKTALGDVHQAWLGDEEPEPEEPQPAGVYPTAGQLAQALAAVEERRDLLDGYLREVWKTATNGFMAPELQAERLSDLALEIAHALGEENWPKGQR